MGKTVLITGASSGFGAYLAQGFAKAGYALILTGRDEERLRAVAEALPKNDRVPCTIIPADLRQADAYRALMDTIVEQPVDIFVNNAAVNPELSQGKPAQEFADVAEIITTNTTAAIALCYRMFEHMAARGGGTIVNINSVAGLRGSAHENVYAASKFGLRGFSESVKDAWLKQGVRMTDVYSGAIATGMSSGRSDVADLMDPEELAVFIVGLCATQTFFVRDVGVQKARHTGPARSERIVFANGIFDLLHPGHIALLQYAKSQGTKLIVGINSDRATRLLKGEDRPIHDETHRKTVLESLRFVDEVVIFDDTATRDTVLAVNAHVVVKGAERTPEEIRANDELPPWVEVRTFPIVTDETGDKLSTSGAVAHMRREPSE
jgi:rfaE bifunctional protein nucleotidyltransferase chain/domain